MTQAWLAALPAGTAILAAVLTGALSRPDSRWSILDLPNERSLHVRPTPRTGGLGVLIAVAAGWLTIALGWGLGQRFAWIAGGTLAIAAVSLADDRGGVAARYRLLVHLSAAALLVTGGLSIDRVPLPGITVELGGVAGAVTTIVFVVWMTNLYNFMDGMDGLGGGMATWGFGFLGYGSWVGGDPAAAAAAAVIAGAALGFLRYNFPPAKIFLGDVGAAPLGFLAAALMLQGAQVGTIPLWVSVLVFSAFIVDATVTLARRLLHGEKIWQAHRTHYYQRLVQLGWGHRRTVLAEYVVMSACGISALAALRTSIQAQQATLAVWLVLYVGLMVAVVRLERARVTP